MVALLVGCIGGVVTGQPSYAGPPTIPGNPGVPGLVAEIDRLQTKLSEANATIEQANATIEQANATIEQANATIEQANVTIEQLQAQVADLQGRAFVARTGQIWCHDETGAFVGCIGTGQDGETWAGVIPTRPRFTDNRDGTVTDNLTKLIWLQAGDCLEADTWVIALAIAINVRDGWCGLTDRSVEGDWRLPNVRELLSLIDYGSPSFWALPIGAPFAAGRGVAWSSTTYSPDPEWVWVVSAHNGDADAVRKSNPPSFVLGVWPVRGPQ
jgi:hypothetical protein